MKGEFDGHLPKAIKTPSPHFRPHEQNKHVQLLQHFSCHYQSGHDQPLEPVHVNCADYNEQMRMYMNIQYNFYTSAFIEYWGRA